MNLILRSIAKSDDPTSGDYQIALMLEKEERDNFHKRQSETFQCMLIYIKGSRVLPKKNFLKNKQV